MRLMHTTETGALITLQTKDTAMDDLVRKIAAIPAEIRALEGAFGEKKNSMTAARDTLVKLQVEKKSRELSIAEKEEEIRKHHRDLNMIKDNDAFKALLSEIAGAKKQQDDIETEILGFLEAIDKAAAEDKRLQQEVKKIEEEKNLRIKDLEAAKTERAGFAAKISGEILEKYEFVRAQRKGLAIVRIKEDKTGKISCGGCNMGLTAQKIVDIKTPDALVFCDNCQRMIYLNQAQVEKL